MTSTSADHAKPAAAAAAAAASPSPALIYRRLFLADRESINSTARHVAPALLVATGRRADGRTRGQAYWHAYQTRVLVRSYLCRRLVDKHVGSATEY